MKTSYVPRCIQGRSDVVVYRFHRMDHLDKARSIAAECRLRGYKTRIVYRGPREKVRNYYGNFINKLCTLKKDATHFDLYVYFPSL